MTGLNIMNNETFNNATPYKDSMPLNSQLLNVQYEAPNSQMTALNFCYWLQGHFEMNGPTLTEDQVKMVREHLDLVFDKKDWDWYGDAGRR